MNCAGMYFLVLSIINLTSLALYLIMTFPKTLFFIEFYLLIICLLYWFYMYFVEVDNSSENEMKTNFVNEKNTNFLADIVFKYLFIILLAYMISYFIVYIYDKDTFEDIYDDYTKKLNNTEKVLLQICKWYNHVGIPLALIIDFLFRKRNRVVNPFFDFLIVGISAVVLCIYEIVFYKFYKDDDKRTRLILITLVCKFILFFLCYFIYDFYQYKVNKIPGNYILCDNSADPRLIIQE